MNCENEYSRFGPEQPLYKTLSTPTNVQIELTSACDNECLHCYNYWGKSVSTEERLTIAQTSKVVTELANNGVFYVTFTGGEPFLNLPSLREGIKEANNFGMAVSLNSNLTSMARNSLLELKDLGLQKILTSLISFDETTHDFITQRPGSFQETIKGIKIAQKLGFQLAVNMVVSKLNLAQIYSTGHFCFQELGINHFCATKASPSFSNLRWIENFGLSSLETLQMLQSLIRLKEELGIQIDTLEPIPHCLFDDPDNFRPLSNRRCVAALTTCTVGADGNIRPCSHTEKIYGNIFLNGLSRAWEQMNEWRTGELLPSVCQGCTRLAACGGGCRVAAAQTHEGNYKAEDPFMGKFRNEVPGRPVSRIDYLPNFLSLPLKLAPNLRFRVEDFGGIIDNHYHQSVWVNSESFNLLNKLKDEIFLLGVLAKEINIGEEEICQFFQHLLKERIVQLAEE